MTHHARQRGKSKYGLARIGKVLLDVVAIKMLISFRLHPLLWFSVLAIPFACLACVAACAYAGGLVFDNSHLLVSAIAFLLFSYLATHFFCVGLLAELVIRAGNRQAFPKVGREHVN